MPFPFLLRGKFSTKIMSNGLSVFTTLSLCLLHLTRAGCARNGEKSPVSRTE